jgi:hypothetical protein
VLPALFLLAQRKERARGKTSLLRFAPSERRRPGLGTTGFTPKREPARSELSRLSEPIAFARRCEARGSATDEFFVAARS